MTATRRRAGPSRSCSPTSRAQHSSSTGRHRTGTPRFASGTATCCAPRSPAHDGQRAGNRGRFVLRRLSSSAREAVAAAIEAQRAMQGRAMAGRLARPRPDGPPRGRGRGWPADTLWVSTSTGPPGSRRLAHGGQILDLGGDPRAGRRRTCRRTPDCATRARQAQGPAARGAARPGHGGRPPRDVSAAPRRRGLVRTTCRRS